MRVYVAIFEESCYSSAYIVYAGLSKEKAIQSVIEYGISINSIANGSCEVWEEHDLIASFRIKQGEPR